jgi:hypothetical protein
MSETDDDPEIIPAYHPGQAEAINHLMAQAIALCDGNLPRLFDLVIASPSFIMSLYMTAYFAIDQSDDVPEAARARAHAHIQAHTARVMRLVLEAVESNDPRGVIAAQVAEMKAAFFDASLGGTVQ